MDRSKAQKLSGSQLAAQEYDAVALGYQEATKREMRRFVFEPTLRKYIGDLSGKRVLDLACGEGYSSRLDFSLGAETVLGIDISAKEIEMAEAIERQQPVGASRIQYCVGDAAGDLGDVGVFDVVTAVMLLHYSPDIQTIEKMLANIRRILKPGGVFITTTPNFAVLGDYDHYGVKLTRGGQSEGSPIRVSISDFNGKPLCSFTNYFWTKETYGRLFQKHGFTVEWFESFVSEEGLAEYGPEFWAEHDKRPIYLLVRASL